MTKTQILIGVLSMAVLAFPTYLLAKHNADHHSHVTRCGERPPLVRIG